MERCVKRLAQLAGMSLEEYLANDDAKIIAERSFQIAIQCVLDIGNHVIAEEALGSPEDHQGVMKCLASAGVLPAELHERTHGLAGFRNILVHDYLSIDHATVHGLLQRLDDLVELGQTLGAYVERRS